MLQLLITNLEEVLLDGQLSLQLSEVGVHEGSVFGAQLRIVGVLLVDVGNSLTKNMVIKKKHLQDFMKTFLLGLFSKVGKYLRGLREEAAPCILLHLTL